MILIVDDEKLPCLRLKSKLIECGEKAADIVAVNSPSKAKEQIEAKFFELLFLDESMPEMNGLEFLKSIRKDGFSGKVVIWTGNNKNEYLEKVTNSEVLGYLKKPTTTKSLKVILNRFYSKKVTNKDFSLLRKYGLTPRQIEIVKLILSGMTNEEIAAELFIARTTVKTHRKNIYETLECHSPLELYKLCDQILS